MHFGVDQRHDDIRRKVIDSAAKGSVAHLDLAWELGAVQAETMYLGWQTQKGERFRNFGAWIAHDLAQHVSTSKALRLATVGVFLRGAREQIDEMAAKGTVGISRLMRLAKLVADHDVTLAAVVEALEQGRVLAEEALGRFPKDTQTRLYFDYPSTVGPEIRRGLTYLALRTGAASLEEAIAAVARQAIASRELPAAVAPFRQRIDEGTFRCKLCGKLPLDPIEVDVGGIVLLCRQPCWSPVVESDQSRHRARWRIIDRQRAIQDGD